MKINKLLIAITCIFFTAIACKKAAFQVYESGNYIQFQRLVNDSSATSFLSLPNDNEIKFPIAVELVGIPESKSKQFKIAVIDNLTTAAAANFEIPGTFTFGSNAVKDTAWITLKKTAAISEAPVRLVLRLIATDDFKIGQTERSLAIINISNVVSQPQWWNSTVTGRFLGAYSNKKFKLFIQVTGRSEINSADLNEMRTYTIMFKNYLLQERDAGRTVYEENNTEMKVALIGG